MNIKHPEDGKDAAIAITDLCNALELVGIDDLAVAGTLLAKAMSIYKRNLSKHDINKLLELAANFQVKKT